MRCVYRSIDEVNYWNKEDSPVGRLGLYLIKRKLWDTEKEQSYAKEVCWYLFIPIIIPICGVLLPIQIITKRYVSLLLS